MDTDDTEERILTADCAHNLAMDRTKAHWLAKKLIQTMFTPYRLAFMLARKPYRIGRLFTHKNEYFGAISVTESSFAALIS